MRIMRCVIISRGCTLAGTRTTLQGPGVWSENTKRVVLFSTKGGRGGDSGEPLPKMDGGQDAMLRACECYRYSGLGVIWQYQPPAPYALQKVS